MKIKDKVENIANRIKDRTIKLIRWAPVIWKDEDWDHYYIWVILHRKLTNMEDFFTSDRAMALNSEEEAKKIRVCLTLLDRLIADDYDLSAFKRHHEKWGKPKFDWVESDDKHSELKIEQEHVKTDEDKRKERKEFNRAYEHETRLRKQDIRYLFDMMRKHIEGFWD